MITRSPTELKAGNDYQQMKYGMCITSFTWLYVQYLGAAEWWNSLSPVKRLVDELEKQTVVMLVEEPQFLRERTADVRVFSAFSITQTTKLWAQLLIRATARSTYAEKPFGLIENKLLLWEVRFDLQEAFDFSELSCGLARELVTVDDVNLLQREVP